MVGGGERDCVGDGRGARLERSCGRRHDGEYVKPRRYYSACAVGEVLLGLAVSCRCRLVVVLSFTDDLPLAVEFPPGGVQKF